jgi:hypothetical protein
MRALLNRIVNVFSKPTRKNENIYKQWNRMRNNATGPSDLAEIDAIFTRHLNEKEMA